MHFGRSAAMPTAEQIMANADVSCPKCKARMDEGYVLDRGHMNQANVATWVAGLWVPQTVREKIFCDPLAGKKSMPITQYRCVSCGYLEAYAK
jgi:hypothetical protein